MCAVLIAHNLIRELTILSEETTSSVHNAKPDRYGHSLVFGTLQGSFSSGLGVLFVLKAN